MDAGPRRPRRLHGRRTDGLVDGLRPRAITRPGEAQPAEPWTRLTLARGAANYAVTTLNDLARGSKLVRATDPRAANAQTAPDTPGAATTVTLDGAARTARSPRTTSSATRRRTRASGPSTRSTSSSSAPSGRDPAIVTAGLAYCEERGDCMFVGSVPRGVDRRRHGDRVRRRLPGQEGLRRALRAVDRRPRPARAGADADQADPAHRPRHRRLRPDRDDARHLQGARRRRGAAARRARRRVPAQRRRAHRPRRDRAASTGSARSPAPGSWSTRRGRSAPTSAGATSTSGCSSTT